MKTVKTLSACLIIIWMISCTPSANLSSGNSTGVAGSGNTYSTAATSEANVNKRAEEQKQGGDRNDSNSKMYSNQPPATVTEGFKKKYPDYTPGDWMMQEEKYTTTYLKEGKSYQANFSNTGEWLGTQNDVVLDDLPITVKQAFQNTPYGTSSNPRFTQIETSQYPILYKASGQVNNEAFTIYFTPEGRTVPLPH